MEPRRATASDLRGVVDTLVGAFLDDPTWAWAFPDPHLRADQHRWVWTMCAASSLRQGGLWTLPGYEAVAVWIPPDGRELSEEDERELYATVDDRVRELLDRFEAAHPHEPPHWYLSLLGTHPEHRGKGLGMQLLRHNLDLIDLLHAPAYLESSNGANDRRYESVGFSRHGSFSTPDDSVTLTTMWRDARP